MHWPVRFSFSTIHRTTGRASPNKLLCVVFYATFSFEAYPPQRIELMYLFIVVNLPIGAITVGRPATTTDAPDAYRLSVTTTMTTIGIDCRCRSSFLFFVWTVNEPYVQVFRKLWTSISYRRIILVLQKKRFWTRWINLWPATHWTQLNKVLTCDGREIYEVSLFKELTGGFPSWHLLHIRKLNDLSETCF